MDINDRTEWTRRDALAAGFSDTDLRRLCAGGQLQRIRAGSYVSLGESVRQAPEEVHLSAARATLGTLPPNVVLSHLSAATAHGLPVDRGRLSLVHVTQPGGTGRRTRAMHLHAAALPEGSIQVVDGIRVTSPARTVVDVARTTSFDHAVALGDAALHAGLVTAEQLDVAVAEGIGRHGIGRARRAVGWMDASSESVGESRSRVLFRRYGFVTPVLQQNILAADDTWLARVDFCWPDHGVVGEFDGMVKYRGAAADVLIAEKLREDRLRAAGWLVVRWTWADLADPAKLLDTLRDAFTHGRPHPSPLR